MCDFIEALKDRCDALKVDRGREDGVSFRVIGEACSFAQRVRADFRRMRQRFGVAS